MRIDVAADFAEILVSQDYRDAANATFAASPEILPGARTATEQLILDAIQRHKDSSERAFETRRLTALCLLDEAQLGGFKNYLLYQKGSSRPTTLSVVDLEPGEPEVVRTNSRLLTIDQTTSDPLEFLSNALSVIAERKEISKAAVGPENYATTLKFFADKQRQQPIDDEGRQEVEELITKAMSDFIVIAEDDKPNFVELTNIYVTIRDLPRGTFGKAFTGPLLKHTLEQLPTFNRQTLSVLFGALGKIDVTEFPEVSATVVDLSMRKMGSFETTLDMRRALRAISNLSPSIATDESFKTFLHLRNNLEAPMDIDGLYETSERLLAIVDNVISDLILIPHAKAIAERCFAQAAHYLKVQKNRGAMTTAQIQQLEQTVLRIGSNFKAI